MLIIKELTEEQIDSLRVMADFNCGFIDKMQKVRIKMTYQDHMNNLSIISTKYKKQLTPKELESLHAGMEALMTLNDMGAFMQKILFNRYKREDNKPW